MKRWHYIGIAAVLVVLAVASVASFRTFASGSVESVDEGPTSHPRLFIYDGEMTLKERIAGTAIIARVRFQSVSAGVLEEDGEFVPTLVFRFQALEYLKDLNGSGAPQIEAVTSQIEEFETRAEAEAEARAWLAARETRWDSREAIVFLNGKDRNYLGFHSFYGEDAYTVASRHSKRWLPEAQAGSQARSPGGQRFLLSLDTPSTGSATRSSGAEGETIALSALKSEIAAIAAEVAAGGGSDEYRDCVARKYWWERRVAHHLGPGGSYNFDPYEHNMESGLAADTQVYEGSFASSRVRGFGENPSETLYEFWLGGAGADLFEVRYPGRVYTSRPLPAGQYETYYNDRDARLTICDAYPEAERTRYRHIVTATAPAGVLHEVFFDPVLVGTAVKADSTNGVLEPASFTDGNSASATLQSISYEPPTGSGSGTVKLQVDPHNGLGGHRLELIELDGSVSLWLEVDQATVDAANKTLSWTVTSQPWDDGDKLMLRVEEAELGIALFDVPSTITWARAIPSR